MVPYRGNGPSKNTFDLTPGFYSLWCDKPAIPTRLRSQCESLMERSKRLFGRINCIVNPECQVMMQAAVRDKQKDTEKYQQSRIEGQATYNASRHDKDKRAHNCAYSCLSIGGPNSRGVVWKIARWGMSGQYLCGPRQAGLLLWERIRRRGIAS